VRIRIRAIPTSELSLSSLASSESDDDSGLGLSAAAAPPPPKMSEILVCLSVTPDFSLSTFSVDLVDWSTTSPGAAAAADVHRSGKVG